jgi:4-amino-4-deoxy-L-arabinose transferase-like glycosyltransferase
MLFGVIHAFSTPIGGTGYQDAPDEAAHISYIQTVASGHLPTKSAPHASVKSGYPDYEWHQPPLYYVLAAPFLEFGIHTLRLFSLLCGLASIVFIYKCAKLIRPADELVWLCAAGIAGFTPAHVAILSAVNNDALLELSFSAVLFLLVKAIKQAPTPGDAVLLGAAFSAAMLTKTTALLLIPVMISAALLGRKTRTIRVGIAKHCLIAGSVVMLLCGWWFVRNVSLYGEPLPLRAFQQSFGGTAQAIDVVNGKWGIRVDGWSGYWLLVTKWCFQSFWAVYGNALDARNGIPRFLDDRVYLLMLVLCIAAVAGIIKLHFRRKALFTIAQQYGIYIELMTLVFVGAAYLLFVSRYFQTQGRYLYPAMSAISLFLAMGWLELFPSKYKKQAACGLLGLMALLCIAFLLQTSNRVPLPKAASSSVQPRRIEIVRCMACGRVSYRTPCGPKLVLSEGQLAGRAMRQGSLVRRIMVAYSNGLILSNGCVKVNLLPTT